MNNQNKTFILCHLIECNSALTGLKGRKSELEVSDD